MMVLTVMGAAADPRTHRDILHTDISNPAKSSVTVVCVRLRVSRQAARDDAFIRMARHVKL